MELVRLSSPPQVISQLLDICNDSDSTIAELVELISTDSALSGKIIVAINSSAFAIRQPVASLQQAIELLGHGLVKSMVLTSSIQQLFAGVINTRKEFVCNAWLDSIYCAIFAHDIAHAVGHGNPDDAYMAGLLTNFGQIVFDARHSEQYAEILDSKTSQEIIEKEIAQFGCSHAELGAEIIELWPSLSPAIADAVRFHHEPVGQLKGSDLLCQIVAEACQLATHWSRFGKANAKWHSQLIDDEDLERVYIHSHDKLHQISASIGIKLTRSQCLTRDRLCQDLEKDTIKLARKIRDASLINVIGSDLNPVAIPQQPAELLLKISREMQLLFSVSDIALFFPNADNDQYLSFYEVGFERPVSQFLLDIPESKFVSSFVEKRSYWIEPEKVGEEISLLSDRQIVRRLNHEIAYCVPLVCGDYAVGAVVIGANRAQKSQFENLSRFIYGYLENVASAWIHHDQLKQQLKFESVAKQGQDEKNIDKLIHEISNPLSVIGNYIDIIRASSESSGVDHSEEISVLKEELTRVGNIVLDFKSSTKIAPTSVLLNEELNACVPLYVKSISNSSEVEIKWRLDDADAEINISRDALRQVILNLIKNAVEAQAEDAKIVVSSCHFANVDGKSFAQFSIADHGKGVDAISRQLLFMPMASRKGGSGRGLGLSVVAEILTRFDGQIKYMENEVGGAVFEVLIPYAVKQ